MKRLIKSSIVLFALLGVVLTSCKKDYPEPFIQALPIGTVYTIDEILSMESGTVFDTASVYGIVTADEVSGNLYKAAFMQDRATGAAIELYLDATSGLRIGDSIRVYLKGATFALYNNLPQLSGFGPDGHIVILANNKPIEPEETTIADVVAGKHLGQVIKLNNVMFTDRGTFAEPTTYGNRTLVDPSNLTQSVIVRTSNYANFANDSLPQGVGNLVAIATVYNTTWQLLLRSTRSAGDFEFENYTPGDESGVMTLPYYQSFASDFGTYTTYDVAGAQSWVIDYSTAKMTGYESSTNYANEDWLISSPVSLEGVTSACMTLTYIARYFNDLNNDLTIQVSTDYESGDPTAATWTNVPISWTSGTDWATFAQTTVDLSQFVGQQVVVAVKYLSDNVKAGTIEVQSIVINEGTAPTPPPGPNPGGEVQTLPYTQSFDSEFGTYMTYDVSGPQEWMIDYHTAKMTGYVSPNYYANEDWLISSPVDLSSVSDAKMTMSYIGRYFNKINDEVTIWASFDYEYGQDPTMASWAQVPATLREGSNWSDFLTAEISLSQFVGTTVTFAVKYISTDSKAGTMEVKSITIEEGSGPTPPPDPTPGGELQQMPYTQSFESEFGTYTTYDVYGPQSWMIDYHTAKMSGYAGGSHANDDWLLSSPVAVTGVDHAMVSVTYSAQYQSSNVSDVMLQVSTDYVFGSDPATATWNTMTATYPNTSSFTDFKTVETSLDQFIGLNVTVAIQYTSTDDQSRTIEIQSITVKEGQAGGDTPTPPTPGPTEGSGTADDPYNVASGIALQSEEPTAWVSGYIVGSVKSGNNTVVSNGQINWSAPFDLATNVVIADDPDCQEITQCIIVYLPSGKPLREQVNLMNNPGNLGHRLSVLGKLRKYFGQAGLRDSNGTEADFVLEGYVPPTPPDPVGIFSESFMYGQGDFTIQNVVMPSELNYVWAHNPGYQCMKGSSFVNNVGYATESWLVSPAFEIPLMNIITLTFEQAVNYASPQGLLSVMIATEYTGDVTTTDWMELGLDQWPAGNNWDFITSVADLRQYMSQTVVIAFKYTSTEQVNPAWEVRNIVVNY